VRPRVLNTALKFKQSTVTQIQLRELA